MKKIILTGATGYIASHLLDTLSKNENVYIYAIVREKSKRKENICKADNIKILELNMENYNCLADVVMEPVDIIINMAWDSARGENNNNIIIQNRNYVNTIKILEAADKLEVKKIIQIGSIAEYGRNTNKVICEELPCHPETAYGEAKKKCNEKIQSWCIKKNIGYVEFRLGSVYGNQMEKSSLIQYVVNTLLEENVCILKSKCTQNWEFIHIIDVINIILKAIFDNNIVGVYNVSNGNTHSLRYFLKIIEDEIKNGRIYYPERNEKRFGCRSIQCNVSKLIDTFEIEAFIDFRTGIKDILAKM